MPTFDYKAKRPDAQTVTGRIIADDRDDAVAKINQLGLLAVSVSVTHGRDEKSGRELRKAGRVKAKELYRFSRQLVNLIKAGVSILRALEILAEQEQNPYFRSVINDIQFGIREGRTFSQCLAEYPRIFSRLYVTLVHAGEEGGTLKESLFDIAEYQKRIGDLTSRVRAAVAYPILMAVFGVGTLIFILTYVMPQITELFTAMEQDLPGPTVVVMAASGFLVRWGLVLLLAVFIGVGLLKAWTHTPNGRAAVSRMAVSVPLVNQFVMRVEMARFTRTLELLLNSGIAIIKAIQVALPVVGNEIIRGQLAECQAALAEGRSFGESLKNIKLVPPMVGHLVSVGEESGSLGATLHEIAEGFDQETGEAVKIMSTLLEPLMIVVVGSLIGFIVVAMLLPIFQLDVFA